MMTSDERKLATASLVPLEIDPGRTSNIIDDTRVVSMHDIVLASILRLSKGVIFDTIVHNIEFTLNNKQTDSLPWKLTGMSLICDASRNKKYMQKLQKMQVRRLFDENVRSSCQTMIVTDVSSMD
jgi:hypothetical protein